MADRSASLRVGLLIVAGVALTLGFIWFFGGRTIGHAVVYESYFTESVQGLDVGATVKYRGVTLGRVTEIGLVSSEYPLPHRTEPDPTSYRQVFVRYEVDRAQLRHMPDMETMVTLGLRARVASQGITGLTYIELDFANPLKYPARTPPWTPKDEHIPSIPSTLAEVQDAAQQVLAKLNTVDYAALSGSLTQLLQDLRTELSTGDAHQALTGILALLHTLQDSVQAADLPGLSLELRRTSRSVRSVVEGEDVKRLLAGGAQTADRLARVSAQLPALVASLQATTERVGNLSGDTQQSMVPLLRDLQATAQNLREVSEALRQAPAQVLLASPPPRAREPVR